MQMIPDSELFRNFDVVDLTDDFTDLIRDYPSIVTWFLNTLSQWSDNWTDISPSEPDSLSLSYISYCFDLINFMVDQKFNDTRLEETDDYQYLHNLSVATGQELVIGDSSKITAEITNKGSREMVIPQFTMAHSLQGANYRISTVDQEVIPPGETKIIKFFKGSIRSKLVNVKDIINGYYILTEDHVDSFSVTVTVNGGKLKRVPNALTEDQECFSVIVLDETRVAIQLSSESSSSHRDHQMIIRWYQANPTTIRTNVELRFVIESMFLLNSYEMHAVESIPYTKKSVNELKSRYLEGLKGVDTIINSSSLPELAIYPELSRSGRFCYLHYDRIKTFWEGTINYDTGELKVRFEPQTTYEFEIKYYTVSSTGGLEEHLEEVTVDNKNLEYDFVEGIYTHTLKSTEILPNSLKLIDSRFMKITDFYPRLVEETPRIGVLELVHDDPIIEFSYYETNGINTPIGVKATIEYSTRLLVLEVDPEYIQVPPPTQDVPFELEVEYSLSYVVKADDESNKLGRSQMRMVKVIEFNYGNNLPSLSNFFRVVLPLDRSITEDDGPATVVPGSVRLRTLDHSRVAVDQKTKPDISEIVWISDSMTQVYDDVVKRLLQSQYPSFSSLVVRPLELRPIDISLYVYLQSEIYDSIQKIENDLASSIKKLINLGSYGPRTVLPRWKLLETILNSNTNIDQVEIISPRGDVNILAGQISTLGEVKIRLLRSSERGEV